jgi:hypothetical protein
MNPPYSLPDELVTLVTHWIVPLFLIYNIIGWAGLPRREANRSNPRLSEQEISDLARAVRGAWFVGMLTAFAVLCGIFGLWRRLTQNQTTNSYAVSVAAAIGGILGILRVVVPNLQSFRHKPPITRRRILSAFVIGAVAASILCAVLYYNSGFLIRSVIASAYMSMLIGYAATHVFEVDK